MLTSLAGITYCSAAEELTGGRLLQQELGLATETYYLPSHTLLVYDCVRLEKSDKKALHLFS